MCTPQRRSHDARSLLLILVLTIAPALAAQDFIDIKPWLSAPTPGLPDLTLRASLVWLSDPYGRGYSSVINVTVENRLTPFGPRIGQYHRAYGSDASNVNISVSLPPFFAQVGGFAASGGFTCLASADKRSVNCVTASLAAGASANIQIEVTNVAENCGAVWSEIRAHVDPGGQISETTETNNDATTGAYLSGPC